MKCISSLLAALGNCNVVFGEAIEFPIAFKRTAEQEHKAPVYSDNWCENEPLATDEPFIDPDLIPKWHIPTNASLPIAVTKGAPVPTDDTDTGYPEGNQPAFKDTPPQDKTVYYAVGGGAAGFAAIAAGVFFFRKRAKPAEAEVTAQFATNTSMNPAYEGNANSFENPAYQADHLDEWAEPEK